MLGNPLIGSIWCLKGPKASALALMRLPRALVAALPPLVGYGPIYAQFYLVFSCKRQQTRRVSHLMTINSLLRNKQTLYIELDEWCCCYDRAA